MLEEIPGSPLDSVKDMTCSDLMHRLIANSGDEQHMFDKIYIAEQIREAWLRIHTVLSIISHYTPGDPPFARCFPTLLPASLFSLSSFSALSSQAAESVSCLSRHYGSTCSCLSNAHFPSLLSSLLSARHLRKYCARCKTDDGGTKRQPHHS